MERTFTSPLVDLAHLCAPILWLGLLLGVSFLATPVKFGAASLTLPVALDVGRVTFSLFNKVEWALLGLLVVAVVLSGPRSFPSICTGFLALLLAAQTIWLLPVLNARIELIIAGEMPEPGAHHFIYIAAETGKLALLVALAWDQAKKLPLVLPGLP